MNYKDGLILIQNKGKKRDKTEDVEYINDIGNKFNIKYYGNDTVYQYYKSNVDIDRYIGEIILKESQVVYVNDFPFNGVKKILEFKLHYKIYFKNGSSIARKTDTKIMNSADNKGYLEYFKKISCCIAESKCGEFDSFLKKQYDKLVFINKESVLAQYFEGTFNNNEKQIKTDRLIFPFSFNLSQKKAVERAFSSSISIIEGPPGTGKTQTILNIVANLIIKNKTVAVVSNNNEAFKNVYEKLEKEGFGFICALLGKSDNIEKFFEELSTGTYNLPDDFQLWKIEFNRRKELKDNILDIQNRLNKYLEDKNQLAMLRVEKTELEYEHFKRITKGREYQRYHEKFTKKLNTERIVSFLVDNELHLSEVNRLSFFNKIRFFIKHKIRNFEELSNFNDDIVLQYQNLYYQKKIEKYDTEIKKYTKKTETIFYKEIIDELHRKSNIYFKSLIYENLSDSKNIKQFTKKNYKGKFLDFTKRFPVILSTTHSIRNAIRNNFMLDYIIIDEASQADLLSSGLALSCAKNAVIVGDLKQLPFIVEDVVRKKVKNTIGDNNINNNYDYLEQSILSSVKNVYNDNISTTFLREHYRCNNYIIQFCNKKFYDNQLIPLANNESTNPLILYKCQPGSHSRIIYHGEKGIYNLREIEVIVEEILNNEEFDELKCSSIGFIAPFRKQVSKAKNNLEESIWANTVHKFQGKEKDTIIFSTVLDKVKSSDKLIEFVDNSNLVNVAVSRAKNTFVLVTDNNLFLKKGTNIGDLMRYIEYSFQDYARDSEIISVFDLLYKEYSNKLLTFKKKLKKRANIESENSIYNLLEEVLDYEKYKSLEFSYQIKLSNLVKLDIATNKREINFLNHHKTSIDFVIYNSFNKEPILAIEVDGVRYHENNPVQQERDKMKDDLLKRSDIQILRLPTNGSGEKEKIIRKLDTIMYE